MKAGLDEELRDLVRNWLDKTDPLKFYTLGRLFYVFMEHVARDDEWAEKNLNGTEMAMFRIMVKDLDNFIEHCGDAEI